MSVSERPEVLIVGGGPSGLMVAHELSRFDIPFLIIERDLFKNPHSRALAVQIRSLEIFHALSLYKDLAQESVSLNTIEVVTDGKGPIVIDLPKTTSFFDELLVVDQAHTELVLERALNAQGKTIYRGVELLGLTDNDDGVIALLKLDNGEVEKRKFAYVVGADGAHSLVRKSMSNQFAGHAYDDAFILADANGVYPHAHPAFRVFFKKRRFLAIIPMHGKNHYRLISVREGESKRAGPTPTIEEFQKLVDDLLPFPFKITSQSWVSRFFVQCRSAAHYQEDRIFLVGDAAHIHSPAGGQGMNTGLQDAFNLAWKLAMMIKGLALPKLLDTYDEERKPVGDFLIDRTDRLFKFMVRSSFWARLLRRFLLPRIAQSKKAKDTIAKIGSQIGIRYETGALCESDEHIRIADLRRGERIPNLSLISSQLNKTDLHRLVIELFFSWIIFLPKNTSKKKVSEVMHNVERIHKTWPKACRTYLVFESDYEAEKFFLEEDYYVAINPSSMFFLDAPSYVVLRPDHHVFCLGLLVEIDHAIVSLGKFLRHGT